MHVGTETVEAVVRAQLAKALGGRRGMLEAAVPTATFTVLYLLTKDVQLAIVVSVSLSALLLVVRIAQRSSVQFVVNSVVGICVGCLFVWLAARRGGSADDQTLAYFFPGIAYNGLYAVAFAASIVVGWPAMGFMVGSVAGDPTAWHEDRAVVRLCRNLTWCLVVPCVLRVAVQLPVYLAGRSAEDATWQIAALGVLKLAMGWPLQLAGLAAMVWLLGRNRTPLPDTP